MRRALLNALLTAALLLPVAHAEELVLADDFNRDEFPVHSWGTYNYSSGGPAEGFYFGINSLDMARNELVFSYSILDDGDGIGSEPDNTWFNAASMGRNMPGAFRAPQVTLMIEFMPGDAAFDFAFTMGPDYGGFCDANMSRFDFRGQAPKVPCGAVGLRITSLAGKATDEKRGVTQDGGDPGVGTRGTTPTGSPVMLDVGGYPPFAPPYTEWYTFGTTLSAFNIVPGQRYQLTLVMGESLTATLTDGVSTVTVSDSSGCSADCAAKPAAYSYQQFRDALTGLRSSKTGGSNLAGVTSRDDSPNFYLNIADGGQGNLVSLDGSTLLGSAAHRFDNLEVYTSDGMGLETIEVEVEAKGRFKKQPIDIKKKGRMQATVYGESGFDVTDIDMSTVTFGATGTETPALSVSHADVDRDGRQDAIFDFAKGTAITPCGTTAVTMMGEGYFEGSRVRFTGTDSRVRVTGCPR